MVQTQSSPSPHSLFGNYDTGAFYDEMFDASGHPRPHYEPLAKTLGKMTAAEFQARCELADITLVNQGITFTVYGDGQGVEKPFPVDLVPRIVPANETKVLFRCPEGIGSPCAGAVAEGGVAGSCRMRSSSHCGASASSTSPGLQDGAQAYFPPLACVLGAATT